MTEFRISKTTLSNYLAQGNPIEEIVKQARAVIGEGGRVLIQQEIPGQEPTTVRVIQTEDELDEWESQFYMDPNKVYLCEGERVVAEAENLETSGGNRPVHVRPTMGGRVLVHGRQNPTIVSFDCTGYQPLEGQYYLYGIQFGTVKFFVDNHFFDGRRSYFRGVKLD